MIRPSVIGVFNFRDTNLDKIGIMSAYLDCGRRCPICFDGVEFGFMGSLLVQDWEDQGHEMRNCFGLEEDHGPV